MSNFCSLISGTVVISIAQGGGCVLLLFHFLWSRRCVCVSQAYLICKFWDVITHKQGYCKWQQWRDTVDTFTYTHLAAPFGFAVPSWKRLSSVSPVLSHVFCYVDVVTREHPRVGKHSDLGPITSDHSSVLGISLPSHAVLLFIVDDVSDSTISTVFHLQPEGYVPSVSV